MALITTTLIKTVLSNITSNTKITYGFYNFSYGQDSNKVYAIGLCRGDVNLNDCRYCLNDITPYITKNCANKIEAMAWFDNCILRYSNRSILGVMEYDPWLRNCNPNYAKSVEEFSQVLEEMLASLRKTVLAGDSRKKYGSLYAIGELLQDLYGLMQCTPDISSQKCDECLAWALVDLQLCVKDGKLGGTIIRPSCNIRYETYNFLESSPNTLVSSPPSEFTNSTSSKGMGSSHFLFNFLLLFIWWLLG